MVAAAGLLLDQVTARPASGFPLLSMTVAWNCRVFPSVTTGELGLTTMDATATIAAAAVVAATARDTGPNAGFTSNAPRKAAIWNSYLVDGASPLTVQVLDLPIPCPVSGVAHVPFDEDVPVAQVMVLAA